MYTYASLSSFKVATMSDTASSSCVLAFFSGGASGGSAGRPRSLRLMRVENGTSFSKRFSLTL
eukprot:6282878-Pyramimonas_sp.AAC.2